MGCQTLWALTPSHGLDDLEETLLALRSALWTLRRRKFFQGIRSGVGVIEPKLAENGRCWSVHCHLVVDVQALNPVTLKKQWRKLTNRRGKFVYATRPLVTRGTEIHLAEYLSKPVAWWPKPGKMHPVLLEVLWNAIRNKRLLVEWGFGRV